MTQLEQFRLDLHRRRAEKQQLIQLRQRIVHGAFVNQLQNERDMIHSRLDQLQPGPKKVAMQQRLNTLQTEKQFRRLRRVPDESEQIGQYTTRDMTMSMPHPSKFAPSLTIPLDRKKKKR